jgi:Rho GDP-dissociation inhibitor
MAEHHDDDFEPSFTTGYKPGEKKTLEEYHTLDAGDESLNKWKQSLGLNQSGGGKSHDDDDDVNGGNERERGI